MKALICGVSGQDGAYLSKLLLEKGYEVIGTSRDAMAASFESLTRLGLLDQVETVSMAGNDFRSVLHTLKRYAPDEVYNLAGQTSVSLSFEQPIELVNELFQEIISHIYLLVDKMDEKEIKEKDKQTIFLNETKTKRFFCF